MVSLEGPEERENGDLEVVPIQTADRPTHLLDLPTARKHDLDDAKMNAAISRRLDCVGERGARPFPKKRPDAQIATYEGHLIVGELVIAMNLR